MRTMDEYRELAEQHLTDRMPEIGAHADTIRQAMLYSLLSGGKRLRPVLVLAACELAGGKAESALAYASAIEYIHTYSLVHDDLPAMDDDTMRRGRPTNHMVYGAGMATLAGDGLLNSAFEIMLQDIAEHADDPAEMTRRVRAAQAVGRGAGVQGMIAGQTADLEGEKLPPSEDLLAFIHANKTGAMIVGAVQAGLLVGGANDALFDAMTVYAEKLGLAFQAADDILDVIGDVKEMGKNTGEDEDKMTYIKLFGLENAKARLHDLTEDACRALAQVPEDTSFFEALARKLETRTK